MIPQLAVPDWLAVATLLAVVVLAACVALLTRSLRAARAHTEQLLVAAASDTEALREQLSGLQEQLLVRTAEPAADRVPVARVDDREYVITELARSRGPQVPARVLPAPQFADILLRESVIKTAALAAGLRRALAPEIRNRIRFEMKREVKRSRKERKLMLRTARRDWESRQRSGLEAPS